MGYFYIAFRVVLMVIVLNNPLITTGLRVLAPRSTRHLLQHPSRLYQTHPVTSTRSAATALLLHNSKQSTSSRFALAVRRRPTALLLAGAPPSIGGGRGGGADSGRQKKAPPKTSSPTLTKERSDTDMALKTEIKALVETDWRLVLHDDDFHYFEEVADVLSACVPLVTGQRAYDITCAVHSEGAATVAVSNKKIIEEYMKGLQAAGLTTTMEPDAGPDGVKAGDGDGDADGGA